MKHRFLVNFNIKLTSHRGLAMERVSVLEFRRDAEKVIRKVLQGKRLVLTYRGKPVLRLEPILDRKIAPDDPFYSLGKLAVPGGRSLTNEEIDRIVYAK